MRAFITGISGFAGSHLAEWLLAAGDVVAGSNRSGVWPAELADSTARFAQLVPWDVGQGREESVTEAVGRFRPDVIFHLAALSVPQDCGETEPAQRALDVNVAGTATVIELVRSLPHSPRLVFVSSGHVYGDAAPDDPVVSEETPADPRTAYAKTKLAAEWLVRHASERLGVDAVIARAFKHAGPRQGERLMLAEWARQFASGASPVRVRCLDSHLDVTDVRDVVRAYRLLAELGRPGMTYNVGSGRNRRTGDLFQQLRSLADPQRPFLETDPGFRQETIADIRRLVTATDWRPQVPLAQTLVDTLEYWRRKNA